MDGLITFEKRGQGGFGYDPVFFYIPANRTFGEMDIKDKSIGSHRYRALEAFGKMWEEIKAQLSSES